MTGWRLTAGLRNLHTQVDLRWPHRDHASDGTIGDLAHMGETSGHNPDDTRGSRTAWNGDPDSTPEVRAWDMDSDLGEEGTTAQMVVDHLCRLPWLSRHIRYMIYNRRLYHSRTGFLAEPYDGPSPHTEHIHFEGAWSQAADDDTSFDYHLEEVGRMALSDDDATKVARAVWANNLGASGPSAAVALQTGFALLQALTAMAKAEAAEVPPTVQQLVDGVRASLHASTPQETAAALKAVLGSDAAEVGRLLAG